MTALLPPEYQNMEHRATFIFEEALEEMEGTSSPRAIAFIIKGLYFYNMGRPQSEIKSRVNLLAKRLTDLYQNESSDKWRWFEGYLTYGNAVIPEALLMAYTIIGNPDYGKVAKEAFNFLLSKIFVQNRIRVISNKDWLQRGQKFDMKFKGGEQPIDVCYTILALHKFNEVFPAEGYDKKMEVAFNWFLGGNFLHQTMYNPCTGGCYDGLEMQTVNLNQGAESTISYLLSRMAFEDLRTK